MLLDELRKLAEMPFLVKYLAPQLGFSHYPVEMRWDNPIERAKMGQKKGVSGLKLLVDPGHSTVYHRPVHWN